MATTIEAKNLGKQYNLQHLNLKNFGLRERLAHPLAWFKHHGEKKEEFWALKDINFSVAQGEILGMIGRNGSGKSTLLKVLSRVTPPSAGEARIYGRIASLLEVGVGFHPELTGRENIFLSGVILGMSRREIAKKFDQIVEFSGTEKFLDTQVKHFSSGMLVRLGFAVAAHIDADILFVDEVLAVGDADFQKKSLAKMAELIKDEQKTILFVSHNLPTIKALCPRSLLLDGGRIIADGPTALVIDKYLESRFDQEQTINN
jgi:lipopolysaccharide transport system ATP-binding protein